MHYEVVVYTTIWHPLKPDKVCLRAKYRCRLMVLPIYDVIDLTFVKERMR